MNAPGPSNDPQFAPTLTRILEWAAAATISLGSLYAFLEKIAKPFIAWRRTQREHNKAVIAAAVRETLASELSELQAVKQKVEGCVERTERGLQRQVIMFGEHDEMLTVITDNRDRIDEINGLLDAAGFTTDRREDSEQRERVEAMLKHIQQQARDRRRSGEEP